MLINHGADCNAICERRPKHAIAAAAEGGHSKCVEILLPHVNKEILKEAEVDPVVAAVTGFSYESLCLLLDAGFPVEIPGDFEVFDGFPMAVPYLRPLFSRQYRTPLQIAVAYSTSVYASVVEKLIEFGAKMTYVTKCLSPFLEAVRNGKEIILYIFLENDVDINAMSIERKCDVPDALLSALSTRLRRQLFLLLCCGLDPALKNWCKCNNGYSLMHDVAHTSDVTDVDKLMKLLVLFSPGIPNCCKEVAEVVGIQPEIPKLLHLCRLAVRKYFRTSKLLHGRFLDDLPIPKSMRDYMTFQPVPEELMPNAYSEASE